MIFLIVLAIIVAAGLWYAKTRPKLILNAEYWVFCKADKLPDQTQMMERVVGRTDKIGPAEGLLFSDVRLHVTLVTKAKNPQLFDPTALDPSLQESFDFVSSVIEQTAIIRVRFTSSEPMKDRRHLRLLPHLAYAYALMADAQWVFDQPQRKLYSMDDLAKLIDGQADSLDNQIRIEKTDEGSLKVLGMEKIGIQPFETDRLDADQFQLVEEILNEFVARSWKANRLDLEPLEAHGDTFEFQLDARKGILHISRRRTS